MKNEMNEIRQLIEVFRVKRVDDSEDSDKPARYGLTDSDIDPEDAMEDWREGIDAPKSPKQPDFGEPIQEVSKSQTSSDFKTNPDEDIEYRYKGPITMADGCNFSQREGEALNDEILETGGSTQ